MDDSTITKTVFLPAAPETVWLFLTNKDKLGEWFHPALADLTPGHEYVLVGKDADGQESRICWGEVLDMDRPNRLVYSFTVKPLNGAFTTVTWQLDAIQGGTRLTLVHEGIGQAAGDAALGLLRALDSGWDEHFNKLRSAVTAD
ncbi:MAG: SRPBCC domain-containing protein [Burkholderiaceae bacterium]